MKRFQIHFDEPQLKPPPPRGAEQPDSSSAGTTLRPASLRGCMFHKEVEAPSLFITHHASRITHHVTPPGRERWLQEHKQSRPGAPITFLEPQLQPPPGAEQPDSSSAGTTLRPFFPLKPASGAQTPLLLSRCSSSDVSKLGKERGERHLGRARGAEQSDPFIRWIHSAPRLL